MENSVPEILRAADLAEMLGCAITTIEDKARARELPGLKYGDGGWVFPRDATFTVLNHLALKHCQKEGPDNPAAVVVRRKVRKDPPKLPSLPGLQ